MRFFLFRKNAKVSFLCSAFFLFFGLTFSYSIYAAPEQGLFWCFSTEPKRFSDVESCDVYVLGTLHLGLPDAAKFTKDVRQALERSNVLIMEIEPSQLLRPEVAQAVIATQPPFVADWLSDQQLAMIDTYFNSPSESMTFRLSKPWAASVMLQTHGFNAGSVERRLSILMQRQGRPIIGLENPQEQLTVFEKLPADAQRQLLLKTVEQIPHIPQQQKQLVDLYLAEDLEGLSQAMREEFTKLPPEIARDLENRLLVQRNANMIQRLKPELAKSQVVFVAVGALHLAGENGFLSSLQKMGYVPRRLDAWAR